MYTPDQDGITHINIYTKGQTDIGKMLSNLSNYGIVHEQYGRFSSLEAFWFWLVTEQQFEELRVLNGFNANKRGRELCKDINVDYESVTTSEVFRETFKTGIECKLRQHTFIRQKLVETGSLPLTHYFFYSPKDGDLSQAKIIEKPQHQWQMDIFEEIRAKTQNWMIQKNITDISKFKFKKVQQ